MCSKAVLDEQIEQGQYSVGAHSPHLGHYLTGITMFKWPPERSLCGLYSLCSPWLCDITLSYTLLALFPRTCLALARHLLSTRSALARYSPPVRLNVLSAMLQMHATASIWEDADLNDLKCLKPTGRSQCARPTPLSIHTVRTGLVCETHL